MRRVLIRAALGALLFVLVAAGAAAGFFWAMTSHFNPAPPRMDYPKPGSALEAQRQDIDYFDRLMALDRSFSPAARAEAERRVADLRAEKTPLAFPQFRAALLEIAALADNGHTHVFYADKARPALFPFRLALFSDGLYVTHASAGQADLLGSRLLAIDGLPADEVMQRLEKLRGGTADWLPTTPTFRSSFPIPFMAPASRTS